MSINIDNLDLVGNRILILQNKAEEKTSGGIILPDSSKSKPFVGIVVAVGDGIKNEKIKVGVSLIYSMYTGQELTIDNIEYVVLAEENVIGVRNN